MDEDTDFLIDITLDEKERNKDIDKQKDMLFIEEVYSLIKKSNKKVKHIKILVYDDNKIVYLWLLN